MRGSGVQVLLLAPFQKPRKHARKPMFTGLFFTSGVSPRLGFSRQFRARYIPINTPRRERNRLRRATTAPLLRPVRPILAGVERAAYIPTARRIHPHAAPPGGSPPAVPPCAHPRAREGPCVRPGEQLPPSDPAPSFLRVLARLAAKSRRRPSVANRHHAGGNRHHGDLDPCDRAALVVDSAPFPATRRRAARSRTRTRTEST